MLGYSGSGGDGTRSANCWQQGEARQRLGLRPGGRAEDDPRTWNDDHGSRCFWTSGAGFRSVTWPTLSSHTALPMPQWASIGGIPALFAEFFPNAQGFTGKKIALDTDTPTERPSRPAIGHTKR